VAGRIIDDWELMLPKFKKVMPHDYKRALEETARERAGETGELAALDELEASAEAVTDSDARS
jgi:glutamate synthase domain-containing protein 3